MATSRLNDSCRVSASISLNCESYVGLRARTMTISYCRTAPRCHLVRRANEGRNLVVNAVVETEEVPKKMYPGEAKGFVEEMSFSIVSFSIHKFFNQNVSTVPTYFAFRNTGLERAEKLRMDLEWFKEQGYKIQPMAPGITYSEYLKDIANKDPLAFVCHFYNIYFAQSAGGRMIETKISERILNNKELEFYKWDDQLSELLQNLRERLNKVSELWTREEKNHC